MRLASVCSLVIRYWPWDRADPWEDHRGQITPSELVWLSGIARLLLNYIWEAKECRIGIYMKKH